MAEPEHRHKAGQRLACEVYANGQLVDRGYEEPFGEETECLYYDLDTSDIALVEYSFRDLWAAEVVSDGTLIIRPRHPTAGDRRLLARARSPMSWASAGPAPVGAPSCCRSSSGGCC